MRKLTDKQKAFIDNYIISLNATDAAIKAGYPKKSARQQGSETLSKPYIKKAIEEKMKKIKDEKIATANEVLRHLTSTMRGEIEEEVVVVESLGVGVSKAIKTKKQISGKDRIKAAELLGKRYMLFTEKHQVEDITPVIITGEDELED